MVEEVRYDFEGHPRYADDFTHDLIKLMIIAKLNASVRNASSKEYFMRIASQIEGCDPYVVKYGQPLLYAKYRNMAFTDQKVTSQFVRRESVIDVTIESVFGEFIRNFDALASTSESKVHWAVAAKDDTAEPLFGLLNSFVDAVVRLSTLGSSSPDSIAGKRFGIRNASIMRKSLHLEFLVDGRLNILELNPAKKKKDAAIKVIFANSETAHSVAALMRQS